VTVFTVVFENSLHEALVVEADSIEDAIEEAETEGITPICHQCCGPVFGKRGPGYWWRETGDEFIPVSVQNAKGDTVWYGPDPSAERAIFELKEMAKYLTASGMQEAALLVLGRATALSQAQAIPVVSSNDK
jgi:hypothetical protein